MAYTTPFSTSFRALTGNSPFPWQEDLYHRLSQGDIPTACDIPTGLGKTAVIPIWLIALANRCPGVPRRLIYVVNRRTVVDQATAEAVGLCRRLCEPGTDQADPDVERIREQLAQALRQLSASPSRSSDPVAISTLRGQLADNRQWSADPSRPAIIVGTVDMIGSRLLFGGYGIGFKTRPMHAGFLGQDALLVHDEAHLEVAFQRLIEAVRKEQENEPAPLGDGLRLNLMALTATSRGNASLELSAKDRDHPEVKKRINARKEIQLQEYDDEKKLADLLVEHALAHKDSGQAVLVFARSVEVVEKVVERLLKVKPTVALTGTMRGKERDALSNDATFRRFLPDPEPGQETVYLVCTSAGEIGINISADHLVCDLSTFESMAQRFGRINRFGTRMDTRIVVLHPKTFAEKDELDSRRRKTLDLLRTLAGDASPAALSKLDVAARLEAFEPEPTTLPTSEILFDAWALTTLRERLPGRPPLEPYLHGLQEQELPTTTVAWRLEVEIIGETLRAHHPPTDLLDEYPLKPHEVLRDRTDRVLKHISALAAKHPEAPVWLLDEDGTLEFPTLKELADKNRKERIEGRTLLLPPSVGGLANGFLNGAAGTVDDVGDDWGVIDGAKRRVRLWEGEPVPDGLRLIRRIDTRPESDDFEAWGDETDEVREATSSPRYWSWYARPQFADDDGSKTSRRAILWEDHTNDVIDRAERIVRNLPLPEPVKAAVLLAARFHDLGKRRLVWQRGIGNPNPAEWLAKSGVGMTPIEINPYRHEFGSLLDVRREPEFRALSKAQKDLVLHLIAAHHGLGRPHFPPDQAFDPEPGGGITITDIASEAAEVPQRFARLQKEYGRWGLAYLESLLRAADYAASAHPSEPQGKNP